MSDFDELLIARSRSRISNWKSTLNMIEPDHVMRDAYQSAIQAEEKYIRHLESKRRPNTLARD